MGTPEIIIRPEPEKWGACGARALALDSAARRFREQLGLPLDRPVIFAGHQAQMWHPGILAKVFALDAASRTLNAAAAWVVVDQDDHEPWSVRYPVRSPEGRLEARVWRLAGEVATRDEHVPVANLTPQKPAAVPALRDAESFATRSTGEGLAKIGAALAAHAREPSAARQFVQAMDDLLRPIVAPPVAVFATNLSRTDLFARVLEDIRRDAKHAVSTYNAAVAAHPHARIAPLHLDGDAELPLWHVPPKQGSPRKRVLASTLSAIPPTELAPRALLMTGLLRRGACALFVHGLGGAGTNGSSGYDAITTDWFRSWLGVDIAPTATVSATLRLCIETARPRITPEQIARARWTAHAARHHPRLLGDAAADAERSQAVATLKRLRWKRDPEAKRAKLDAYRSLHRTLDAVRTRRSAELARFETEASDAASRREEAEIIADRTWAWPLYEAEQIIDLKRAIDSAFATAVRG